MSDRTVRVLLFAAAREIVGAREIELTLATPSSTVRAISAQIAERYPALAGHMRSLRIAVNGEYVRDDDPVNAGDEVAVIPPVAGG